MFTLNEDLSIYATRGDAVFFSVQAEYNGETFQFQPGDVVRLKIYGKKNAENVLLQKDFPVTVAADSVAIYLTEADTKLGEVISKPTDYWYEVELNPFTEPQTIIGYDEDGAKIFRLFPEGNDVPEFVVTPEDIPVVDKDLDLVSTRPVQNQAIARAVVQLRAAIESTNAMAVETTSTLRSDVNTLDNEIGVERSRIDNLVAVAVAPASGDDAAYLEVADIRVGYDGKTYTSAGKAVREQIGAVARQVKVKNLIDFHRLIRGFITADGTINNYNNGYTVANEVTTDFIKVGATGSYYFGHRFNAVATAIKETVSASKNFFSFALYDANKAFIKRVSYDTEETVIDASVFAGASYVRVSYRTYMFNSPVFAACGVPCEAMDEVKVSDNLLETYPMIFNGYLTNASGAVIGTTHDINGYIPTKEDEKTSGFIPCEGGREMFLFSTAEHDNWLRIAFYGADGAFMSSIAYSETSADAADVDDYNNFLETFVIPENAVALRISCRSAYIQECVLAYNDSQRRYLYKQCERSYKSKYEAEKVSLLPFRSFVKAVAHRGQSNGAPENTLSAYRLAAQQNFEYVECDISFTSDGVPVLLHDGTIDRTSDGTGNISKMTLAEARAYDYGSWFSSKYAGEKIPTAEEFIALCRKLSLHPYIEVKSGNAEQIKALVGIVRKYGMLRNVTWISFSVPHLKYVKDADPAARLGYVVDSVTESVVTTALGLRNDRNEVFVDTGTDNDKIALCIAADIPVERWTINAEEKIFSMNPYISGVTSNYIHAGKVLYNSEIKAE